MEDQMPSRYLYLAAIVALAVVFLALAAIRVWRGRASAQGIMLAPFATELTISPAQTFERVQYVSTTLTDDPLNRIHAHGLGFRGWAELVTGPQGLLLKRRGESNLALTKAQIVSVKTAQATIDRGVEVDGLIQIDWTHDLHQLSTFLRAKSGSQKLEIIAALSAITAKEATK